MPEAAATMGRLMVMRSHGSHSIERRVTMLRRVLIEEQLLEIHRLALRGEVADIAQDVTHRLAGPWTGFSRFREVRALCTKTLALGPAPTTLIYLARATQVLGDVEEALRLYFEALKLYKDAGDRAGLAATLSNLGIVYANTGQPEKAL